MKTISFPPELEVTLRVTIASFVAYCLSVAYLPNAIPPSLGYLVGIAGPAFSMNLPTLLFSVGAVIPVLLFGLIAGLCFSTMLLAAAAIQDANGIGLMVFLFAFCTFWFSGMIHDKSTKAFPVLIIVLGGMNALSLFQLVHEGLSFVIAPNTEGNDGNPLFGIIEEGNNVTKTWNCTTTVLQNFRFFGGQTATICPLSDGGVAVNVPGGMHVVKGLWLESGLENPLALMRNFLICFCWAFLCVAIGPLLPPYRTARRALSTVLLPAALRNAATHLEHTGDEGDDERRERTDRLVKMTGKFFKGDAAAVTAYEPLIWRPLEYTWVKLKDLIESVNDVVLIALAVNARPELQIGEANVDEELKVLIRKCATMLNQSAAALETGTAPVEKEHGWSQEGERADKAVLFGSIEAATFRVVDSTNDWILARKGMSRPIGHQEALKNLAGNITPWIYPYVAFFRRLFFQETKMMFSPSRWRRIFVSPRPDLGKFCWCLKFAIGGTALFAMSVYWDEYQQFELSSSTASDGAQEVDISPVTIENPSPKLYGGWNLATYLAATTQTVEGTSKKGFLRLIGTVVGAFSAWLALLACGQDDPNVYGVVAWLTVTTFLAVYFSLENGALARMGLSKDYGSWGFYVVLTQALILLEVYVGAKGPERLIPNRIAANISGVLMAIILAVIPPCIHGGNPRYALAMVKEEKKASADLVNALLMFDAEKLEKRKELFDRDMTKLRRDALELLQDASPVPISPVYRIDSRLQLEIDVATIVGVLLFGVFALVKTVLADEDLRMFFAEGTTLREELFSLHKSLSEIAEDSDVGGSKVEEAKDEEMADKIPLPKEVEATMHWIRSVSNAIEKSETRLGEIKFGLSNMRDGPSFLRTR